MPEECRITLYLRQQPEEQALYRYLMRRSKVHRMALIRNMILAEFRRRRTKESTPTHKKATPRPQRATVNKPTPPTTGTQTPWTQRVTF